MRLRSYVVTAVFLGVVLAACGGNEPPPPPAPTGPTPEELAEQARQDSIRAAEEAAAREAAARAEAEQRAARERDRLIDILEQRVFFEFDQSRLTSAAESTLRQKVEILRDYPGVQIRLEGHADERGSTEYNLALGSRRASEVLEFFTGFGIAESRFATVSYGEERPLVSQSTESAWSQNRRVEFVITAGRDSIRPQVSP